MGAYLYEAGQAFVVGKPGIFSYYACKRKAIGAKIRKINRVLLQKHEVFRAFQIRRRHQMDAEQMAASLEFPNDQTLKDMLETAYQKLRATLVPDLLKKIKKCSPEFFEQRVIDP